VTRAARRYVAAIGAAALQNEGYRAPWPHNVARRGLRGVAYQLLGARADEDHVVGVVGEDRLDVGELLPPGSAWRPGSTRPCKASSRLTQPAKMSRWSFGAVSSQGASSTVPAETHRLAHRAIDLEPAVGTDMSERRKCRLLRRPQLDDARIDLLRDLDWIEPAGRRGLEGAVQRLRSGIGRDLPRVPGVGFRRSAMKSVRITKAPDGGPLGKWKLKSLEVVVNEDVAPLMDEPAIDRWFENGSLSWSKALP